MLSLCRSVKRSWSNNMSSLFPVTRRESSPDELPERRESSPGESPERRESLPDELIEEILSWLPVKSAVRFNIVCKLFHTIIQDKKFIEKHMQHAKIDTTIEIPEQPQTAPLTVLSRINGLLLEKRNSTGIYHIRNYATNRIVELPELKEPVLNCSLNHILPTNLYKVLVVHWEGYSGIGMMVLTVGTDIAWRPIQIPYSLDRRKNRVTSRTTLGGINYIVEFSKPDLMQSKMIAIKLEDETCMEIVMPRQVLLSSKVWAVQWELKISLICKVEDGFRVWVLDDGKRSKWSEKKLIFQTHGTSQDEVASILKIVEPQYVVEGSLLCKFGDQQTELIYDIKSERITYKGPILPRRIQNQNTLVTFRGMH